MGINWAQLPATTAYDLFRAQLNQIMRPETYGFGEKKWTLTEILKQNDNVRIAAMQLISGDAKNGLQRPDRAFAVNGIPMMFRLQVLTRQACYMTSDGKKICINDDQYRYDQEGKIMIESSEETPEHGDVVRWKDRMKDPDTTIQADVPAALYGAVSSLMAEPHLSSTHLDEWERTGQDCYIYGTFSVDKDGCISVPIKYAQPMLKQKGFRMFNTPQFGRQGRMPPGEKPPRRITNWWFKEVPLDFKDKKRRQQNADQGRKKEVEPGVRGSQTTDSLG